MGEMRPRRPPRWPTAVLCLLWGLAAGGCASWFGEAGEGLSPAEAAVSESDYKRGKRHLAEGRFGLAVLNFRTALAESPDSLEALNGLGAAFDQMGRFDLALRAYGRALALAPQDAAILNNIGYSYLLQGRYDLAVVYLRAASLKSEGDARILANRRLAETALARAGGPPANQAAAEPVLSTPPAPLGPHLVRAGKGVRHLVTRPPEGDQAPVPAPRASAAPGRPAAAGRQAEFLPGFLSAPMALGVSTTARPALGSKLAP